MKENKNFTSVTINCNTLTNEQIRQKNMGSILKFYQHFRTNPEEFNKLWTDDCLLLFPMGLDETEVKLQGIKNLGHIFNDINSLIGKYDWIIQEIICGEDPNVFVLRVYSDIDVDVDPSKSSRFRRMAYKGTYIHIFKFENFKIKEWIEAINSYVTAQNMGLGVFKE
ncbi:hypothetical protein [Desulfitobacterium chlororespirans]|uniref:SnoaL-like domain-containing protein n=1 Tax=Desulfitobacterium chlororespirans DSM 11544 TaxID=1121395 RepID=A0A1M7SJB6_9FIRM|nr:hypothetical protein [Desulfitobacterium chlororespirans]SHN58532.1 hypothetical protein SAMN02745215_00938 [Desulfitobacterium chlororespirans DSM 11544]